MVCKYCHSNSHYIDKCPTIICKNCKDVGHPQWLCKQKKINNNKTLEKKYFFTDDNKNKQNVEPISIVKNINYYLKLENKSWSNLI